MDRRSFLAFLSAALMAPGGRPGHATETGSIAEPLTICVSLNEQHLRVFEGLREVAASPISSGKAGHATPTGIFSILDKRTFHRSNIYSDAPMPFMQRLTWSGIALHASNHVPAYPASHGCVRMPDGFARELFALTGIGAHVVISRAAVAPRRLIHRRLPDAVSPYDRLMAGRLELRLDTPGPNDEPVRVASAAAAGGIASDAGPEEPRAPLRLFLTRRTHNELTRDAQHLLNVLGFDAGVPDGFFGPVTAAAVRAFQREAGMSSTGMLTKAEIDALYAAAGKGPAPTAHLYARRDFVPLFDMPVGLDAPERPLGTHLLTVTSITGGRAKWHGLTLADQPRPSVTGSTALVAVDQTGSQADPRDILDRLDIKESVMQRIARDLTPGSSLAISDNGLGPETGKGTDFIVLTRA